jgi:hypothetical protein
MAPSRFPWASRGLTAFLSSWLGANVGLGGPVRKAQFELPSVAAGPLPQRRKPL